MAERGPGGPRVRRAWRILGSLAVGAMLLYGAYQVVVSLAHERYTFDQSFDAAGIARIEVHNGAAGAIRIVGADTDTITVTGRVDDGLRRTGHTERVEGDGLVLDSSCPQFGSNFCSVRYTIEAPRDLDIVATTDHSRITISDIDGDVDADSDNGRIELARIGGTIRADGDNGSLDLVELTADDVEATTDNGGVHAQFDRAPRSVVVDSDNGSVEVVLPDDGEVYRLDTDTDNGAVSTQVNSSPSSRRTIEATSDNGDVTIRYPRS